MSSGVGSLSDAPYAGYSGSGHAPPDRLASDRRALDRLVAERLASAGLSPSSLRQSGPSTSSAPAPSTTERPRLRDLRQGLAAPAKPARRDRFARWHVPESMEHESESWLLPYLDVVTLLLALLVALLAFTRMDAGRQGTPIDALQGPPAVQLVGSIGSDGLTEMAPHAGLDLPAIPAAWASLPDDGAAASLSPAPYISEPAGPGMTARVPVPPGTSPVAAEPGIGGTAAATPAGGPAPADATASPAPHGGAAYAGADTGAASIPPAEPAPAPPSIAELGLDELGDAVDVIVNAQSISFRISNELLFPSGQADLGPAGLDVLQHLADIVNRNDYRLSVEGHSDAVPIQTERYPSNWELSTARATSVLRQLERSGVASSRLSATGYADTRPIASNGSVVGRAANRRVELIMQTGPTKTPS